MRWDRRHGGDEMEEEEKAQGMENEVNEWRKTHVKEKKISRKENEMKEKDRERYEEKKDRWQAKRRLERNEVKD